MPNNYALDANNNMLLDNRGLIRRVTDGAQVVQLVRSRLLFYFGEAPIDTSQGVPYRERILVKPADLPQAETILKTIIIQTIGVAELVDFGLLFDSKTRKLNVTFKATTIFGDVIDETINIDPTVQV